MEREKYNDYEDDNWFLGVPGIKMIPGIICKDDEQVIMDNIDSQKWGRKFQGGRIQEYGNHESMQPMPSWINFFIDILVERKALKCLPTYMKIEDLRGISKPRVNRLIKTVHHEYTTVCFFVGDPVYVRYSYRYNRKLFDNMLLPDRSVIVQDNKYPQDWIMNVRQSKGSKKSYMITLKYDIY